jgi:hypothetical protein
MVVAQGRDVEPAGSMVALMHSRSNLVLGCPAAGARVELAGPIYPGPIPGIPRANKNDWGSRRAAASSSCSAAASTPPPWS